jgi:hypothetical protein
VEDINNSLRGLPHPNDFFKVLLEEQHRPAPLYTSHCPDRLLDIPRGYRIPKDTNERAHQEGPPFRAILSRLQSRYDLIRVIGVRQIETFEQGRSAEDLIASAFEPINFGDHLRLLFRQIFKVNLLRKPLQSVPGELASAL